MKIVLRVLWPFPSKNYISLGMLFTDWGIEISNVLPTSSLQSKDYVPQLFFSNSQWLTLGYYACHNILIIYSSGEQSSESRWVLLCWRYIRTAVPTFPDWRSDGEGKGMILCERQARAQLHLHNEASWASVRTRGNGASRASTHACCSCKGSCALICLLSSPVLNGPRPDSGPWVGELCVSTLYQHSYLQTLHRLLLLRKYIVKSSFFSLPRTEI